MTSITRLMADGDGLCHWCGKPVRPYQHIRGRQPKDMATEDHVYPRGHPARFAGAPLALPHLVHSVLACHPCNQRRGNMPYTAFLLIMRPEWREFVEEMVA